MRSIITSVQVRNKSKIKLMPPSLESRNCPLDIKIVWFVLQRSDIAHGMDVTV